MTKLLLALFFSLAVHTGMAQSGISVAPTDTRPSDSSATQVRDYAAFPYWITMMDEPRANYFEVQRAFYTYWKNKEVPVREDNEARDIFGTGETEQPRPTTYVYEYKRFKFWERYYKDLIDEEGFILSPEQIIAEWEKQQKGAEQK